MHKKDQLLLAEAYNKTTESPTRTKYHDGSVDWTLSNGLKHHDHDWAHMMPDGTKVWYQNGLKHREDGPAYMRPNGTNKWYINNALHREHGPACMYADGSEVWLRHGLKHRLDGPAHVDPNDGTELWYVDGALCHDEQEFQQRSAQFKKKLVRDRFVVQNPDIDVP